jgi:cytochrome c553
VAPSLVPLTSRPESSPLPTTKPANAQPDPGRVLPHLATRALIMLRAVDACLDAIDGPHHEEVLRALRSLHEPKVVEGLVKKLATTRSPEARPDILSTLVRLYHREADYQGSWWAASRALQAKGDAERGKSLFAAQSCRACHTDADGQTPKEPQLADLVAYLQSLAPVK